MIVKNEKRDIFDKIMELSIFRGFYPIYIKNKTLLLYAFFGVLTTIVSLVSFWIFSYAAKMNAIVANTLSWICAVLFAYLTNRKWVFSSGANTWLEIGKEISAFLSGRFLTYILEDILLFLFAMCLGMNRMIVKIVATIIVIILNYVISKFLIFK